MGSPRKPSIVLTEPISLLDAEFDDATDDLADLVTAVCALDDDAEIDQLLVQYGLDADEPLE